MDDRIKQAMSGRAKPDISGIPFESCFRNHDSVMLLADGETGQLIDANDAALRFYGYTIEQMESMNIGDITALPLEELDAVLQRALQEKQKYFVMPNHLANGKIRIVEGHTTPIEFENRNYLFLVVHDITDHGFAEKTLLETEDRYRALFEQSGDAIALLEPSSARIIEANRNATVLLGYSKEELCSMKVTDLDIVETLDEAIVHSSQIVRTGKETFETKKKCKDGSILDIEVTVQPISIQGQIVIQALWRNISDRKKAARALRESEEQHRTILETAMDGILLMDSQGRLLEVNESYCQMSGYSIEELLRMSISDLEAAETKDSIAAHIRKVIMQGEGRFESSHRRKDGSVFDIEASVQYRPVADSGRFVCFLRDITDRKRADKALKESEERYRALFASSMDAIMTLEPPLWRFTSGNAAAVLMFGAKDEAHFTSMEPWALSPEWQPDGRLSTDKAMEMIEKAMRDGCNFFEWTHRQIDGQDFSANVLLTRMEHGGKRFLQATVRDVTDIERVEEKLRESENRYRTVFDQASDGIIIMSMDGENLTVNESFARMHGYSVHEMKNLRLDDLDTPETARLAPERLRRLVAGEAMTFEVDHFHKDGHSFPLRVSCRVVQRGGQPYFLGFHQDTTEQKRAELKMKDALAEAQRFRDALDHVSAHIYMKDLQYRYIYANRSTLELFGCSAEELFGCDDTRFFPPKAAEKLRKIDSRVFQGEQTSEEVDVVDTKGKRRVYLEVKTPVYAEPESKTILGLLGISTDITDRK
jgi:PAS domain S-box-containing protein